MPAYSKTDKFLHRLYLSNYSVARSSLELDSIMFGKKAKDLQIESAIFVTGLARSGTTAVMRKLFETGEYASLQYSNMPFLLCPNLWNRISGIEKHERAHKDGIFVDGNSPEALDEFFWKAGLRDSYIKEKGLIINEVDDDTLKQYIAYIKLICYSKGKKKYISKNNNSVLRLSLIERIPNRQIIVLYRDPLSHASSLLKLHKKFSGMQSADPFILEYFDFLGHHEFGLHHKPFLLTDEFNRLRQEYDILSLNYWLAVWLNYYKYIIENLGQLHILLRFEDLIEKPDKIYSSLWKLLSLDSPSEPVVKHQPGSYLTSGYDKDLLAQCNVIYDKLSKLAIG